jgi:hypothetical protein
LENEFALTNLPKESAYQSADIGGYLHGAQSGYSAVIRQLPVTDEAITLSESVMWIGHSCWKDELIVADFRLTSTN